MKKLLNEETKRQYKKVMYHLKRDLSKILSIYFSLSFLEYILCNLFNINMLSGLNLLILIFKLLDNMLVGFIF